MKLQEQGKTEQSRKDLGTSLSWTKQAFTIPSSWSDSTMWDLKYLMSNVPYPCLSDRLALIRQERAEAAKKREEERLGSYWINFFLLILYWHALKNEIWTDNCNSCFSQRTKEDRSSQVNFVGDVACLSFTPICWRNIRISYISTFYMSIVFILNMNIPCW